MGNRLSKIYTRTGDDGSTGLGDGSRVDKTDARVEAMGAVDELNSMLGVVLCEELPDHARRIFVSVQHRLFDLGGELSLPGQVMLNDLQVDELEHWLDEMNAELAPLKDFILPGGERAAALCHLARSLCRRAERRVHALTVQQALPPVPRRYLNRLSDLLFVMARWLNHRAGVNDVLWQAGGPPQPEKQ